MVSGSEKKTLHGAWSHVRYRQERPSVYLAGPITGLTYDDCSDWREYAKEWLAGHGIDAFSPMRGKSHLKEMGVLGSGSYPQNVMSTIPAIVQRDRWDCQRADAVLFNLLGATSVSIGTMVEYGWADAARRIIVTVMEDEWNVHDHGFVRQLTGYRVNSLDEALTILPAILLP